MREYRLIRNAINKFDLNLKDRVIVTEAASNEYLWTPIIAALSGAEYVFAITEDSIYASADEVIKETMFHAENLEVHNKIRIVTSKKSEYFSNADIITNLGFVRPINKTIIKWLKDRSVVCLMWEPWEFRWTDLDLVECWKKNIPVFGTNERDPRLNTYKYVGLTVIKLILEQKIEIFESRILLIGSGILINETKNCLIKNGAEVIVLNTQSDLPNGPIDCIICLEHHNHDLCLIGEKGLINDTIDRENISLIIHVCGNIDKNYIADRQWHLIPSNPSHPGYMSFTTAYLGPKPVIDLHTAGLKIGEAYLSNDHNTMNSLALLIKKTGFSKLVNTRHNIFNQG